MSRNIELSFKTFILLVVACAVTGLFVGGLGHYYGGSETVSSKKEAVEYAKTITSDSVSRIYLDQVIKKEAAAAKFHASRADKAEALLRTERLSFDSLLKASRIKSRPVVNKQDYINADQWILDYNKTLKR